MPSREQELKLKLLGFIVELDNSEEVAKLIDDYAEEIYDRGHEDGWQAGTEYNPMRGE